ncbi:MAG: ATP-dependent helicase [Wujia sp.]
MRFSKAQTQAIRHVRGPMMVIAGPGSGKTTVITNRVQYLIESAGVRPADILVITFTRAAAGQMEQRFLSLTKQQGYNVRFGTFHSVFYWIVKTAYKTSFHVIAEEEKRKLVEQILSSMKLDYENKDDIVSSAISQISLVKCNMMDIDSYYSTDMPEDAFRSLYRTLEKRMKQEAMIDFDDMLTMCYDLLKNRPDILAQCRKLFPYILVDEFQDSNLLQYEIFKMLALPQGNAFVVGDDDQSVYGFRGARPEIMQQFQKDFKGTKLVFLGENHRCDQKITQASTKVIGKNKNRYDKSLQSLSKDEGVVEVLTVKDEIEENEKIIEQIRTQYSKGLPYEQQAVLYRTNLQPRRLAYKLNQYNIPYTLSEHLPNIFDHFAVRYVLDYMRMAMGDTSRATFLRIVNKPSRYISRDILLEDPVDYDKLRYRVREKDRLVENLVKLESDIRILRKLRPWPALNFIRNAMCYNDYIKSYAEYRNLDAGEMFDILDEFAYMIQEMKSYGELFEFIDEYKEVLAKQQTDTQKKQGVMLMTMHSAKGLEFDTVHILDAVEDITPYKKAKTKMEMEEERRMFYVAMTRARHNLYIYCPQKVAGKDRVRSRFVNDI